MTVHPCHNLNRIFSQVWYNLFVSSNSHQSMISVTPLYIRLIFWPINNNGIADWTEDRRDVDHQDKSAVGFSNCHYGSCFQCFQRHSCWRGSRSCYSRSRHVRWVFTSLWPCHCFSYDEDWKAHSLQLTPLAPPTFTPSAISHQLIFFPLECRDICSEQVIGGWNRKYINTRSHK